MTPVQYWVYEDMGIASEVAIRMAFATDLLMILPATAASALGLCVALAVPCRYQHNHDAGGVSMAHRLAAKQLTWISSAAALYVGLRIMGVFDWLGWPIRQINSYQLQDY
jgi:hypothetical protein